MRRKNQVHRIKGGARRACTCSPQRLASSQVHRIKAERDILATAEHPYVVKLYYSFASREHLYLVMEFVNGGDLLSLLKAVGFLDESHARQYVPETAL
jgi:serine/threonine protein kinase